MGEKGKEPGRYYIEGIRVPETPPAGEEPSPWKDTAVVGRGLPRVDGYERVSGTAVYPSDVVLPGMLYGEILRCPHPHAMVKKVDISAAGKMPGVRAILTGDSPWAREISWPYSKEVKTGLFDSLCRFEGETVAAVAADTPYQARDAVRAIGVEYEILPYVVEMERALKEGAPRIHGGGNEVKRDIYERGDVRGGFEEADAVAQGEFSTACELHTPLELHGCVAFWEGDRLTIHESTQGVFAVQSKVAEVLHLPLSKVRVVGHYVGGGFGSKLQPGKYTVIAALLAKETGRAVKVFLPREDTFLTVGNRPPARMTIRVGARKDGTLTAMEFKGLATGGAYPAGGTSLLDWLVRDLYLCPNVRTETIDVYTNTGPARPFRAPGHPQCAWALEQTIDELAEKIGMDPVQLRLKNIPDYSQARKGNPPYTSTGLRQCLEDGARTFEWEEARRRTAEGRKGEGLLKRGVGMAATLWFAGGGGPPSTVIIKVFSDGSVNLNMGASDIGTGTKTIMAMVAAEELGVRPDSIQIENADTGTTQYATPSGGSKTVPTEAPTVRAAAVAVKRQLLEMAAEDLRTEPSSLEFQGEVIAVAGSPEKKVKITDISLLKKRGEVVGVGYRGPNPEGKAVNPFAAQFCEVEVNTGTGEVKIIRFLGTHESGRVMDPLTFDSQVYGGITMGIGFGATEFRVLDHRQTGKMVNRNWHDYKLPTALDVPKEIVSVQVEIRDEEANTTGAKGLGEPVTIPTAAAFANAVYDATGLRVAESPINPVRLSRLMAVGGGEK